MADSRRWNTGSGARRDDDFTRAPAFRDGYDSAPLSETASWHGSGSRHVALAVGLAVMAAVAAVAFMVLAPSGGHGIDATSGSAANGGHGAGGVDAPDAPIGGADDGPAGNATSGLPSPLPTLPPVP
jgi:hypothetical protein